MMSDDTGDGDCFPLTTAAHMCGAVAPGVVVVLQFVSQGPSMSIRAPSCLTEKAGWCMSGLCTFSGDQLGVLQVTGSLLLLVVVCCCIVLCYRLPCEFLHVPGSCCELLIKFVCGVKVNKRTVPADSIIGVMASSDSRAGADQNGVSFQVHVQVPWNAAESVVTLDSPGVVVLDTSHVPDVLGLRTRNADAELLRVLPGRAQDSVRVLIPGSMTSPG